MLPRTLIKAAIPKRLNIGRHYDRNGKHICYWLRLPSGAIVYKQHVSGMLAAIRRSGSRV